MNRYWKQGSLILAIIWTMGCATTAPIRYPISQAPIRSAPFPYKVVVDIFKDDRPADERTHPKASAWRTAWQTSPPADFYTSDSDFKPAVAKQIAEALAQHLKKVGLFQDVTVRELGDMPDQDPEIMNALAAQGIDLVITGRLTHFTGYQSAANPAGMMFGAIGVLTEAIANPKSVRGSVEYSDYKVINVKQQRVLWYGAIEHRFDRKDTFYKGPTVYALEALKEANNQVAAKLNELLQKIQKIGDRY